MNIYPKCARSFIEFNKLNTPLLNVFNSKKMNISIFDVTLRDGLQGLSSIEQDNFTTDIKKEIYNHLIKKYNPMNIEIGSCINKKILPIFNDTENLLKYTEYNKKCVKNEINHFILVPNQEQLINALKFGAKNFSFVSSVSNSFQFKNTKMSLSDNYRNLTNMMYYLQDYSNILINSETDDISENYSTYKIKLYVSCINECPIEGKISTNSIIGELVALNILNFDTICLSDTCGTLTHKDFVDIIEKSKMVGLDIKKFSLHLHVKPNREKEVEEIFHTALDYGIREFDVSDLKSGGCSITINKNSLVPNMSYEQFYKFLTNYMIIKSI